MLLTTRRNAAGLLAAFVGATTAASTGGHGGTSRTRVSSGGGQHAIREIVAYHRLCCAQVIVPALSGSTDAIADWAAVLGQLEAVKCVHTYGMGRYVGDHRQSTWPEASHEDEWSFSGQFSLPSTEADGTVHSDEQWSTSRQSRRSQQSFPAGCAAIQLIGRAQNVTSTVNFYTAEALEDLTALRPKVRIETGRALMEIAPRHVVFAYRTAQSREYSYHSTYNSDRKLIRNNSIVTRSMAIAGLSTRQNPSASPEDVLTFIEVATKSRALPERNVKSLIFEDDVMTVDKLKQFDVAKEIKNMEKEGKDISKYLPTSPSNVQGGTFSSGGRSRLPNNSRSKSRRSRDSLSRGDRWTEESDFVDLTMLKDTKATKKAIDEILKLAKVTVKPTDKEWLHHMRDAFTSTSIQDTFPRKTKKKNLVTAEAITEFFLVNSLLSVSEVQYNALVDAGARDKLERSPMPLSWICAGRLEFNKLKNRGGKNWLADSLDFSADEVTAMGLGFRALEDADQGRSHPSEPRECFLLALPEVSVKDFKDVPPQPLNLLVAVIKRKFGSWTFDFERTDVSKEKVDLWKFLKGGKNDQLDDLLLRAVIPRCLKR